MSAWMVILFISTLCSPTPKRAPAVHQEKTKGCPYCCCNVVNDGTSTNKQMLEACEKTQGKMCRDMCKSEAVKHGVRTR